MMLPFLLEILEGHSAWAGLVCVCLRCGLQRS